MANGEVVPGEVLTTEDTRYRSRKWYGFVATLGQVSGLAIMMLAALVAMRWRAQPLLDAEQLLRGVELVLSFWQFTTLGALMLYSGANVAQKWSPPYRAGGAP